MHRNGIFFSEIAENTEGVNSKIRHKKMPNALSVSTFGIFFMLNFHLKHDAQTQRETRNSSFGLFGTRNCCARRTVVKY